jgi:hypothetical protein
MFGQPPAYSPSIVSRWGSNPKEPELYLQYDAVGDGRWVQDPQAATAFESMREAIRAASHLPGELRAFGVPLGPELLVRRDLH